MSIPKEPRQLMINLMYLVLTAMLALNVSAEIINAFFAINKGIGTSNEIVTNTNGLIKKAIDTQVKAYPKPENQAFQNKAEKAMAISKEFEAYIKDITDKLVTAAGGPNPKYTDGRPIRYKDKDVTTNMFITGGKGKEIQDKIEQTRAAFLALVDEKAKKDMETQIALQVDAVPEDAKAKGKTWVDVKFKQMPVAAVMPILTKMISDAKTSETALLNHIFNLVGGVDIKFDQFKVAIAPKRAYLNRGEKFEAEVYLAAYSSNPNGSISIAVNGQGLPLVNGVAKYETTPSGIGKQTVKATASIKNPLTGQTTTSEGSFEYEIGESSATVSAEKMNVFYIGVTNPLAVSVAGYPSNKVSVSCAGCDMNKVNDNNYNVTASRQGEATVTVSAEGKTLATKKFRVKMIPDPRPQLPVQGTFNRGGVIPSGVMRAQSALMAVLENFDFDAKCSIQSFSVVKVRKNEDPQQANNNGGEFSSDTRRIVGTANAGDNIAFMQIMGRCPGDVAARSLGSMSFFVK